MGVRCLTDTPLRVHPDLVRRTLASPTRRLLALVLDLDLWREPNRRPFHDRAAGTVVLRVV